jgi:putative hydrolase of the HAD superfamily
VKPDVARYTSRVRALLLDLDDTLLDYSGGVDAHWEAAVTACAPPGLDRTLLTAITETRRWFWDDPERHRRERVNMLGAWQHIVEFALERLAVEADGLAPAIARDFAARRRDAMRLFPDAVDSLESFRRRGVRLALVTNGDASQQRDKIERHGLARFFDVILIEGEFGVGKPEEIVYRHVLRSLGTAPDAAWMAGDHLEFDVEAPQKLGLFGVWIDRGGQGLPAGSRVRPHRVVRSLRELAEAGG